LVAKGNEKTLFLTLAVKLDVIRSKKKTRFHREIPQRSSIITDVFMSLMNSSDSPEIRHALLDMSMDSVDWREQRANYSASFASTSVAGYILPIGDRNPHQILLKTIGAIVPNRQNVSMRPDRGSSSGDSPLSISANGRSCASML
jgi:hypothetical protein